MQGDLIPGGSLAQQTHLSGESKMTKLMNKFVNDIFDNLRFIE
jgi:hypothetical protein